MNILPFEPHILAIHFSFSDLSIPAIVVSVIAGQIISTIWYVVLFGAPWAKEYGNVDQKQHTKEVPLYTYFVGLICTTLLVLSIAFLQQSLDVSSLKDAIYLGLFVAVGLSIATSLPGYAFLKRWSAFYMALGSQVVMILGISIILALWK